MERGLRRGAENDVVGWGAALLPGQYRLIDCFPRSSSPAERGWARTRQLRARTTLLPVIPPKTLPIDRPYLTCYTSTQTRRTEGSWLKLLRSRPTKVWHRLTKNHLWIYSTNRAPPPWSSNVKIWPPFFQLRIIIKIHQRRRKMSYNKQCNYSQTM